MTTLNIYTEKQAKMRFVYFNCWVFRRKKKTQTFRS